ncbi:FtsX-like permease family protein [Solibacillus silvestris]|uniref:FtsX-like permease family protein n=1 Tax=Solibacillus silvestris TaxID=76853 RepID=UPI003F7DEA69
MQIQVESEIKQHARGSYDLLVRPEGTRPEVEEEMGFVEENYLGVGEGGITLADWRVIKALSDVEVAAPIASLGYFNGGLKSLEVAFPPRSSWMRMNYYTTDGIHNYQLGIEEDYFLLQQDGFFYGFEWLKNDPLSFTPVFAHPPQFTFPVTYHLTVGIDREEEENLTGFDFNMLTEEVKREILQWHGFDGTEQMRHIPIIYLEDATLPVQAEISQQELDWRTEDTVAYKEKLGLKQDEFLLGNFTDYAQVMELYNEFQAVKNQSTHPVTTKKIDLSNYVRPFFNVPLAIDGEGQIEETQNFAKNLLHTANFYFTKPISYEIEQNKLTVRKIGEEHGIPLYRETSMQENASLGIDGIPFALYPVGTFTTNAYQNSLSASPLGVYQQAPSILIDGTVLKETILPGSFVSAPAHGLMNIEDAEFIKGEAPIDAIRIRVADIDEYNAAAEAKILNVVEQIYQLGNFEIDIVAGSSPRQMAITVEGIGEVTQPWTSLGAAAKISESWNFTTVIIAALFLIVTSSYLINRLLFRSWLQVEERKLLLELGWHKKHVRAFYTGEFIILTVFSFIMAVIILFAFGVVQKKVFYILGIALAVTLLLIGLNSFAENRPKITVSKRREMPLLLRNLFYFKRFLSLTFLQLITVTVLTLLVGATILRTVNMTGDTNLGSYINDNLLISLLFIMMASLFLSVITIGESTISFLTLRQEEIRTLKAIGWKKGDVLSLYLKESLLWSIGAIILGGIFSFLLFGAFFEMTQLLTVMALCFIIFLCVMVIMISYTIMRKNLFSIHS